MSENNESYKDIKVLEVSRVDDEKLEQVLASYTLSVYVLAEHGKNEIKVTQEAGRLKSINQKILQSYNVIIPIITQVNEDDTESEAKYHVFLAELDMIDDGKFYAGEINDDKETASIVDLGVLK